MYCATFSSIGFFINDLLYRYCHVIQDFNTVVNDISSSPYLFRVYGRITAICTFRKFWKDKTWMWSNFWVQTVWFLIVEPRKRLSSRRPFRKFRPQLKSLNHGLSRFGPWRLSMLNGLPKKPLLWADFSPTNRMQTSDWGIIASYFHTFWFLTYELMVRICTKYFKSTIFFSISSRRSFKGHAFQEFSKLFYSIWIVWILFTIK
jgi:hypothetical protein